MKPLFVLIAFAFSATAFGRPIVPGSFTLYSTLKPKPCDVGVRLAIGSSSRVTLKAFIAPQCNIALNAVPYEVTLTYKRSTGCGSWTYAGRYVDASGKATDLVILDHRYRHCGNTAPTNIMVGKYQGGKLVETLLSAEPAPATQGEVCLERLLPMIHETDGNCITARTTCEANDLKANGYRPREDIDHCPDEN